jgi:hypothetical protein
MQMYQVQFQSHYEDIVDLGNVIVCATSADVAEDMVIALLDLPQSKTIMKTARIKPSLFSISRREIHKPRPALKALAVSEKAPGSTQRAIKFRCQASAVVSGLTEEHAVRRLADSIRDRAGGRNAMIDAHTNGLAITCDPIVDRKATMNNMEKVEMYKAKRFVQG